MRSTEPEKALSVVAIGIGDPLSAALEQHGVAVRQMAEADLRDASLPGDRPDVVLLGPGIEPDRVAALRDAWKRRSAGDVPIVALVRDASSLARLRAAGVRDCIAMRESPDLLAASLRRVAEQHRRIATLLSAEAERDRLLAACSIGTWRRRVVDPRVELSPVTRSTLGLGDHTEPTPWEELRSRVHPDDVGALDEFWERAIAGDVDVAASLRVDSPQGWRRVLLRGLAAYDFALDEVVILGSCIDLRELSQVPIGTFVSSRDAGRTFGAGEPSAVRELREGLRQGQLRLYYQAQVDAASRAISGVEALIRWQHPARGLVLPEDFIPLAERHGLIGELGAWVIDSACRQAAAWLADGLDPGLICVNLSPRQFEQPDLARDLLARIEASGLAATRVQLELTESCLVDHVRARAILQELCQGGLKIAIDDFGTGYSSLQYLRDLPLDALKIDRAFVSRIDSDEAVRGMVVTIISLAWSLGLRVVAEGVQTESQWEFLADHGCDEIQGFLFSEPVPAAEFARLLERSRARSGGEDE